MSLIKIVQRIRCRDRPAAKDHHRHRHRPHYHAYRQQRSVATTTHDDHARATVVCHKACFQLAFRHQSVGSTCLGDVQELLSVRTVTWFCADDTVQGLGMETGDPHYSHLHAFEASFWRFYLPRLPFPLIENSSSIHGYATDSGCQEWCGGFVRWAGQDLKPTTQQPVRRWPTLTQSWPKRSLRLTTDSSSTGYWALVTR